jgi:hypothetical protein
MSKEANISIFFFYYLMNLGVGRTSMAFGKKKFGL